MTAPRTRTNEEWVEDLGTPGQRREVALEDLRQVLVNGLRRGLVGQVDTNAPEFAALAVDFVQEALLKVLDNLASFAGRRLFTSWANKIALSIGLTELRRKRWRDSSLDQLMQTDDGEFTPSFVADLSPRPESLTERRELLAYVGRLIGV